MNYFYSVSVAAAILWSHSAAANDTAVDLGTLGGTSSEARAINGSAQIVGTSRTASGEIHAFLWEQGVMKDLGLGDARAINERGDIAISRASQSPSASLVMTSHLIVGGEEISLAALPGEDLTVVNGVNDQGLAVGSSGPSAVIWNGGIPTALPSLGGTSYAAAINNRGWVVGASKDASGLTHAVVWVDGAITDLGTLGGGRSVAYSINEAGQIVGESGGKAFVWQDGVMTRLPTNSTSGYAFSINEAGVVAGKANHWARDYAAVWDSTDSIKELTLLEGALWAGSTAVNDSGLVIGNTTYGQPGDFSPPTSIRATLWK